MREPIKNRYEFIILFDVENGNPNGDPDAGNMPRTDQYSGYGLVTDGCIKHKIRKYVQLAKEGEAGYRIYIQNNAPLSKLNMEAYDYIGVKGDEIKDLKKTDPEADIKICDFMCSNFYDIRTFGAVLTTFQKNALNCGQVCGPVQINIAKSIDPIVMQDLTITRTAITTEKDFYEKSTEMGRKTIIPYALYRAEGYISANLAQKTTGFSEEDLELLWEAIINMFEHDHSAARGKMTVRELIVFKHSNKMGDCSSYKLFDAVQVKHKDGVDNPMSYDDYEVIIHKDNIPEKVQIIQKI